ncbi:hypothetical protein NDU88_005505 [Pleurodeles waltl]|uniref:Uncharacterized protein n=1 Tax=Pleurodeles waltl TaxID=8319 RepID=A0AAV7UIC6_PLEWA|nr:hypothetical protein NDU88_005505 [Pleurodeles waltl]
MTVSRMLCQLPGYWMSVYRMLEPAARDLDVYLRNAAAYFQNTRCVSRECCSLLPRMLQHAARVLDVCIQNAAAWRRVEEVYACEGPRGLLSHRVRVSEEASTVMRTQRPPQGTEHVTGWHPKPCQLGLGSAPQRGCDPVSMGEDASRAPLGYH